MESIPTSDPSSTSSKASMLNPRSNNNCLMQSIWVSTRRVFSLIL
jgi:hypothetical protein